MKRTPSAFGLLAMLAVLVTACGQDEPAQVWFISPTDGQEVEGPDVLVELGASGVEITSADIHDPGTGHHHIFVNTDLTPLHDTIPSGVTGILHLGQGQTEFLVQGLEPGEHRLMAVLADHAHIPLDPPAIDTVHFTVVDPNRDSDGTEEEGTDEP
jgi:hypothetical protein